MDGRKQHVGSNPGVYGTLGTPAAGNIPGGRGSASSWTDRSGNFWLFGGYGFDANFNEGDLNDLWEFNPSTNEWAWMGGSNMMCFAASDGVWGTLGTPAPGNIPGCRGSASSWTDRSGNLWLFGGWGDVGNDDFGTLNDLWEYQPGTSQTITFGALTNQSYGTAPFNVSATASSGLTVSFNSQTTSICTVSGPTVTLVAVGTCTIQATQRGNAIYAAAIPVNQSFQVTQEGQTITFGALANQSYGTAPFNLGATASSGLTVSFSSQTTSVCTVSGTTVTLVAVGTCTLQATQAGNTNYAAATTANQSFQVTQGNQTITFAALLSQALSTPPFAVSATASSGLTVSFKSATTPVCSVSGSTVALVALGTCTIHATQAGNADYAAATPVNRSFLVTPLGQTIAFGALSNRPLSTPPFTISAKASSGLAVKFYSLTPHRCTVSGSILRLVAVGTCTIEATQAGNANYAAATPVLESFEVTKGSQTITFGTLSNQTLGTPPFTVSATASSGLTVSFNSRTTPVCTVSGTTVTLVTTGTCTIQATQAGNANYKAAAPVDQSFLVTQ